MLLGIPHWRGLLLLRVHSLLLVLRLWLLELTLWHVHRLQLLLLHLLLLLHGQNGSSLLGHHLLGRLSVLGLRDSVLVALGLLLILRYGHLRLGVLNLVGMNSILNMGRCYKLLLGYCVIADSWLNCKSHGLLLESWLLKPSIRNGSAHSKTIIRVCRITISLWHICTPVSIRGLHLITLVKHHGYLVHHSWLCHVLHGLKLYIFLHGIASKGISNACVLHITHLCS